MGCGCKKGKGGCSGPHCPPEQQTITTTTYRIEDAMKTGLDEFPLSQLVRVKLMTKGAKRQVFGIITKRYLGNVGYGEFILMPSIDYNEYVRNRKTSFEFESSGFDAANLPYIGEKLAHELRFTHKLFSKEDLIKFGVSGFMSLSPLITEDKANEIISYLENGPRIKKAKPQKTNKTAVKQEFNPEEAIEDIDNEVPELEVSTGKEENELSDSD